MLFPVLFIAPPNSLTLTAPEFVRFGKPVRGASGPPGGYREHTSPSTGSNRNSGGASVAVLARIPLPVLVSFFHDSHPANNHS